MLPWLTTKEGHHFAVTPPATLYGCQNVLGYDLISLRLKIA